MFFIPKNKYSERQFIDTLNWPDSFPYKPSVSFVAWHDGQNLFLEYEVEEQGTKAEVNVPGQEVYMDSCVECFIKPLENDPRYYNFEWNAIGNLAMACRTGRNDPQPAPADVIASVGSVSTLGKEPFLEKNVGKWTLKLKIPSSALFNSGIDSFDGRRMWMNLYKCGDGLKVPHYVTWQAVGTAKPDYHRPEFFVPVVFE